MRELRQAAENLKKAHGLVVSAGVRLRGASLDVKRNEFTCIREDAEAAILRYLKLRSAYSATHLCAPYEDAFIKALVTQWQYKEMRARVELVILDENRHALDAVHPENRERVLKTLTINALRRDADRTRKEVG
jgi:hypothetical protein